MTEFSVSSDDLHRFDCYLAGDIAPDAESVVEDMLRRAPREIEMFEFLRSSVRSVHDNFIPDTRRIWGKIGAATGIGVAQRGIHIPQVDDNIIHKNTDFSAKNLQSIDSLRPRRATRVGFWSGLAAGAIAFAVIAIGTSNIRHLQSPHPVPVSTYTTNPGERATIMLPDGSAAMLNVGSRLEVPVDYLSGNRNVRLSGEAYFTVAPNVNSPFTVVAGRADVRVLGTAFVVRHYSGDDATVVAVHDGKVSVRNVVLGARQQVSVAMASMSAVTAVDDTQFAFVNNVLVLDGRPIREMIPLLNRWYNVDIQFGDASVEAYHWEANLEVGSPSDLIAVLESTFPVRVVRSGRTLTIYSRR